MNINNNQYKNNKKINASFDNRINEDYSRCLDIPIVDIQVFIPSEEEIVPDGYIPLTITPYGSSADVNNGVVNTYAVYLCILKADSPYAKNILPIIDIDLVYSDDEIPKDYFIIEDTVSGLDANLNNGKIKINN